LGWGEASFLPPPVGGIDMVVVGGGHLHWWVELQKEDWELW